MEASDRSELGEGQYSTVTVTVNVPRDQSVPTFTQIDDVNVDETLAVNMSVTTVKASDTDLKVSEFGG